MTQDADATGIDAPTEDKAWQLRVNAASGESTPISLRGWLRVVRRVVMLVVLIVT